MFSFFQSKEASTNSDPTAPVDKVVPLHYFDDGPLWRAFILYSMFVFDEVLDAEKLHSSLERLIRRDGWWKLGARLRKNQNGDLEYHIPPTWTSTRPPLTYTHVSYSHPISDHPLASRLPKASSKPAVVGDPDVNHALMMPPGSPMKLADYLNADIPQLGLHIASFSDTTLVSLYWPHTLFDAMGKKALLNAWTLMLQGKDDEVKTPYGVDFNPLETLGTKPSEEHKLAKERLGTWGMVGYGLGQVPNFLRQQENRMVCVPRGFVAGLREKAMEELEAEKKKEEDGDGKENEVFVSEGDVLCAWWTRLAIAHLSSGSSNQTVVLNNAYCMRKALKQDWIPEGESYLSNAIAFLHVLVPVKDIVERPLSYLAARMRSAIVELGTREQVEAFYAMLRESQGKMPPFFGDRNMHLLTYSNWTKAKLFEVNFGAAIVGGGGGGDGEGTRSCRPRYIQNNQFGLTLPNGFPIIGKDGEGNYWLSGYMNKGNWAQIEELLAKQA